METFKQHVEIVFTRPLKSKTEAEKCAFLMIWVGDKGRNIFATWNLEEDDRNKLSVHYEKFEEYVKPRTNVICNKYRFQTRIQADTETFDQFVTELKLMVRDCNYERHEEMVQDRIVIGVKSHKIREKLINVGSDLTLQKALDIARLHEQSTYQARQISGEDTSVHVIHNKPHSTQPKSAQQSTGNPRKAVYTHKRQPQQPKPKWHHGKPQQMNKCSRCGYEHSTSVCPAKGNRCHKGGQPDHFARKCRTKAKRMNVVETCSSDSESDELFLGYICADINTVETEWNENIEINDRTVRFQLDTGVKCNVLPLTTFKELGLNCYQLALSKTNLKSYSGHRVKPVGNIILQCYYQDHVSDNTFELLDLPSEPIFEVVDLPSEPILGSASCSAMGLVKRTYKLDHAETTNIPKDIQSKYSDVLKGLGLLP